MKAFQNLHIRTLFYFLFLFFIAGYFIYNAVKNASTFSYSSGSPVELGLSIVVQDPAAILRDLRSSNNSETSVSDSVASYLLQSSNPAAQIFLDYIIVDEGAISTDLLCLQSIVLTRGTGDPIQLFSDSNWPPNLKIEGDSYINKFQGNRCVQAGKNIVPHILLGIVSVDSTAVYGLVDGFYASLWYPFDEQKIKLNITVMSDDFEPFSPSLQILVVQPGWDGIIDTGQTEEPTLHLKRPNLYRVIFFVFFISLFYIVPYLNYIASDSFFEVAFGLLLGLWGIHQILVPAYIESSILIDIFVYTLYFSVFMEIIKKYLDNTRNEKKEVRS